MLTIEQLRSIQDTLLSVRADIPSAYLRTEIDRSLDALEDHEDELQTRHMKTRDESS